MTANDCQLVEGTIIVGQVVQGSGSFSYLLDDLKPTIYRTQSLMKPTVYLVYAHNLGIVHLSCKLDGRATHGMCWTVMTIIMSKYADTDPKLKLILFSSVQLHLV